MAVSERIARQQVSVRKAADQLAGGVFTAAARQNPEAGINSVTMEPAVDVGQLRKVYTLFGLYRKDLFLDPYEQFRLWFEESVRTAGDREPNAMTLATASPTGVPSARVVLLKNFDARG